MWKTGPGSWKRLVALFTGASLIEGAFFAQFNAFTPLYLPHLGVAPADVTQWTGAIPAISSAVGLPFLPFWGALADRYARQPVIVRSFVAHLAAGIIAMLAPNVWVFVLGRSVQALSLGNSGLMMTTLTERAPRGRVGLALSIMNTAGPIGIFVGPLLGGPVVDRFGFPTLLAIDVALMLAVILGMSFGYRDDFRGRAAGSLLGMTGDSLRIVGGSARLRALFPALFLLFAGWMVALTYVPLAVTALYRGSDPATAVGLVAGASGLVTLVVSPAMGALADRFGHWRVLYAGAIATIVAWPLPALAGDLVTFAAAWAVVGGLTSGVFALSFSVLAASARPEVRGRVMSFAYLPVNVGFAIGPALGSIVTRASLFAVFPTAAALTALGVGALAVAQRQATAERAPAERTGG